MALLSPRKRTPSCGAILVIPDRLLKASHLWRLEHASVAKLMSASKSEGVTQKSHICGSRHDRSTFSI